MKKIYLSLSMLCGLFAATSCSDDNVYEDFSKPETESDEQLMVSVVMPEITEDSRMSYDDSTLKLTWDESDTVTVVGYKGKELVGMQYFTLSAGAGTSQADFKGMAIEGATDYVAYYKNLNLMIDKSTGEGALKKDGMIQHGNGSTLHLKGKMMLKSGKITKDAMETEGFKLTTPNCIIRFDINNLPTDINGVEGLVWTINADTENSSTLSLEFDDLELDKNKLVAYITFEGAAMELKKGSCMDVTITSRDNRYFSSVTVDEGKQYQGGERSSVVINNWKVNPLPKENEIWAKCKSQLFLNNENYECSQEPNELGYYVIKKVDGSDIETIDQLLFFAQYEMLEVVLPSHVKSVANSAFRSSSEIRSIQLPEGLQTIEKNAFAYCEGLNDIYIPKSVTKLDPTAFLGCNNLHAFKTFNGNGPCLIMNDRVIAFAPKGNAKVVVPKDVKVIADQAFANQSGIVEMILPEGLDSIGDSAFKDCNFMKSIYVPQSVKSFGAKFLYRCASLSSFGGVYASADKKSLVKDSVLLGCAQMDAENHNLTSFTVPEGVTEIAPYACFGCCYFKQISFPNTLRKVSEGAFSYSFTLPVLDLPVSVEELDELCFSSCSGLQKVIIRSPKVKAKDNAFSNIHTEEIELYINKAFENSIDTIKPIWAGVEWKNVHFIKADEVVK